MVFDAPHHPRHGREACAVRGSAAELRQHVLCSLPLSSLSLLEKHDGHCKKTKKSSYLFVDSN